MIRFMRSTLEAGASHVSTFYTKSNQKGNHYLLQEPLKRMICFRGEKGCRTRYRHTEISLYGLLPMMIWKLVASTA